MNPILQAAYGGNVTTYVSAPCNPAPTLFPPAWLFVIIIIAALSIIIVMVFSFEDQKKCPDILTMNGKLIVSKTKIYRVKLVEIDLKEKPD